MHSKEVRGIFQRQDETVPTKQRLLEAELETSPKTKQSKAKAKTKTPFTKVDFFFVVWFERLANEKGQWSSSIVPVEGVGRSRQYCTVLAACCCQSDSFGGRSQTSARYGNVGRKAIQISPPPSSLRSLFRHRRRWNERLPINQTVSALHSWYPVRTS